MRTLVFVCLCLCCGVGRLSAKLAPQSMSPAYTHLAEVNARWLHEASLAAYLRDSAFVDETARIRYHLLTVHHVLSARAVVSLSAKQALARRASLNELLAYAHRGRFPINTRHTERTPYFVDADGTHCAVGYLLHRAGADALVREIRASTNHGYVLQDLLQHPGIGAWAAEHGFTAEELAWIQPGYPGTYLVRPRPFGRGLGVEGGRVLATARGSDGAAYLAPVILYARSDTTSAPRVERFTVALDAGPSVPLGSFGRDELVPTFSFAEPNPPREMFIGALLRGEGAYAKVGYHAGLEVAYRLTGTFGVALRGDVNANAANVDQLSAYWTEIGRVRTDFTFADYEVGAVTAGLTWQPMLPRGIRLRAALLAGRARMRWPEYNATFNFTQTAVLWRNTLEHPDNITSTTWAIRLGADAPVGPLRIGIDTGLKSADFSTEVLNNIVGGSSTRRVEDTIKWRVLDLGLRVA